MKKIYEFAVFCMMFVTALCVGNLAQAQAAVSLNQTNATICAGGKTTLKVNGTTKTVKWSTSDKNIAKVNAKGVVTGVKKGKATITAGIGTKKYSCRVVVNQSYGASQSAVSIKNQTFVTITFTKDAVVTYKIENADICSASWGSWDGNEVKLYITPKKVGVTYITCSNGANSETIRIRVKVTKVPVNVTDSKAVTDDGGDFVCGVNAFRMTFKQDRASQNTVLYLIDRNGETIRTIPIGKVSGKKNHSVSWDGCDDRGVNYQGEFRLKFTADGYTTRFWDYYKCYAKSPFAGGNGTKDMPYEVTNAGQLKKMADFNGRHFIQTQDIDLRSDIIGSIFSAEKPFNGSFNAMPKEVNYQILNYNGNTSLFGVIGAKGRLDNVIVSDAYLTGNGQERVAVLADINQGTITNCAVSHAVIYSASATDAALLAVENSGMIDSCALQGVIYTYGNMAGCAVYNHQRIIRTAVQAGLNLSAASGVSSGTEVYAGGVAAVNGQTAFIDSCESDCSMQASGILPAPAKLYMGGIAGKNLGQVRDGNALGYFPLDNTKNLIGDTSGGIIVGENDGMISRVAYCEASGRKSSAAGNGREDSLSSIEKPK